MKNYFYSILALCALTLGFTACSEDDLDDKSVIVDSQKEQNEFDKWIFDNYIKEYNIDFKYRYEDIESDMNYYLVPADYNLSIVTAKLVKHLGLEPYDEITGSKEFIRKYYPKMIQLIGSGAYRNNGTFVLGTAEGGLKITLYFINNLQLDPAYLNEYYFHTMHHEFAHILHQTKPYSTDFDQITGGDYVTDSWSDDFVDIEDYTEYVPGKSDPDENLSLNSGFITSYAGSEPNEDFVELISTYITNTPQYWNNVLQRAAWAWEPNPAFNAAAAEDYQNNPKYVQVASNGAALLQAKFDIVYNYMMDKWNIDLNELRDVILRRQGEIGQLELDKL